MTNDVMMGGVMTDRLTTDGVMTDDVMMGGVMTDGVMTGVRPQSDDPLSGRQTITDITAR